MDQPVVNGSEAALESGRPAARRVRLDMALLAAVVLVAGAALGYSVFRAAGGGSAAMEQQGDVAQISDGEAVDLKAHLAPGKYTIFDFYADWCPPCRALAPELQKLAERDSRVAIRTIDVVDWASPVVAQHGIEGLPHMILYDPSGSRLAEGSDVYLAVSRLFQTDLP